MLACRSRPAPAIPARCALPALLEALDEETPQVTARLGALQLFSHFQPIISLSHRRAVGHEALMRGRRRDDGSPVSPLEILVSRKSSDDILELDRLSRLVHLKNFARQADASNWLFLNMHAEVFLRAGRSGNSPIFLDMLLQTGIQPQQIVIEVLENAVRDDADFGQAVDFFRSLGCLIALDDFGAGHSNFDRVWQIQPEIVKLDRSLILQAGQKEHVRRVLVQMVSLLHECGALVLMEGIETREEAHIALEADVDFVQGFYFARPQAELLAAEQPPAVIQELWQSFDDDWQNDRSAYQEKVAPYLNALGYASVLLSAGRGMEEACASFLALPGAEFCYLLDAHGQQIGANHGAAHAEPNQDARFRPLADAANARWARRPYFRRAIDAFGKVQITRPYLSISSARLCVTLSASFRHGDEKRVVCGDVRLNPR